MSIVLPFATVEFGVMVALIVPCPDIVQFGADHVTVSKPHCDVILNTLPLPLQR